MIAQPFTKDHVTPEISASSSIASLTWGLCGIRLAGHVAGRAYDNLLGTPPSQPSNSILGNLSFVLRIVISTYNLVSAYTMCRHY
jgi:hypothetical protein